ncbi:MAG: type II/IV secretion system ATPase subunit [Candidatus Woesearchaeota archaeon]
MKQNSKIKNSLKKITRNLEKKQEKKDSNNNNDNNNYEKNNIQKITTIKDNKTKNNENPKTNNEIETNKEIILEKYEFKSKNIPIEISIKKTKDFVPHYEISISQISKTTELILEKIRQQLVEEVSLGFLDITDLKKSQEIEEKFKHSISVLINKYFPDIEQETKDFLTTYLIEKSLGLGNLEIMMDDNLLEEIVINSASEPVWVYHKKYGWLKTNLFIGDEDKTRHYASMIGRKVGRQISVLEPLLDAHLNEGDRVNATLFPISTSGNTITFRKFSRNPFTITHFLKSKTMTKEAASLIWLCMQYELSAIIAGGTASGKTSVLNVLATFFPPNQRIISIEDTREIRLPKFLHWLPMSTRQANAEGKGSITMEDLLVNSLRQRPDRILVGEVRRKMEAETLFEAIHTGHSVYATFHANSSDETVQRLTNPPIDVPKTMLPAISLIIVQFRNRRTGQRRTFQIAEILPNAEANVLMQYNPKQDKLINQNKSKSLFETLKLFTGFSESEIKKDLKEKEQILDYLIKQNIETVDEVGRIMAEYYTNKDNLMKFVKSNKKFVDN